MLDGRGDALALAGARRLRRRGRRRPAGRRRVPGARAPGERASERASNSIEQSAGAHLSLAKVGGRSARGLKATHAPLASSWPF